MTIAEEIAAIHKSALRRNRPALIRSYVVRILGGQSLMLGNSADNPSPTTFDAETCYAFNLTGQSSFAVVTTGTTAGVLGETRLGAVCPVIDYAKRRHELLGENTIFVQLAWSGSALLQSTTNALSARWDTLAGESGFLTSSNLTDGGTPLNPTDRIGMMDRIRAVVAVNPKIDLGAVEFHWQQGHADAPSIYNGTSSASDYRAALDRVRDAVRTNYGAGRVLVWAHGWVKQTGATTQEVLNATHSLIHTQEDDFVSDRADVVYASLACRDVLGGNMVTNANGEWVRGGADGLLPDGVHLNADFARAIGRRAAADIAYADGVGPEPETEPAPRAAMLAEHLAADEYTHDWANLTGWTVTNVQVSANRLYGITSGANPSACYYPFAVAAGESARVTCEIVRVTGVAKSIYVGFETVGGTILASLPNFCGIGTDGSSNFEAFIGANFTGVTTGATDVLARTNTGGSFTVTVSADPNFVSLVIRSADNVEEGSMTIPRSSLPGGGAIAGITVWNTDTRGTSGSYAKGIGVRKSLTPFRTKTVTGGAIEGTSGQVIHRGASGDKWRIHLPKAMDGETAHPICLFTHQAATGDRNSPWDETRARAVLDALDTAGYIVISADDQGDRWGNAASLTNYASAVEWVRDNFYAGPVVLWSPSMGAAVGLNLIMKRALHVRAIAAICPVCDIPELYRDGFETAINAAYGVSDLPGLETAVVGFNPLDGDASTFTGKGVKFWVSTGTADTIVPEASHAVLLQPLIAPYAAEATIVEAGSGHLQTEQYDAAGIVALFDAYV